MVRTKKVLKKAISKDIIPINEQTWLSQPVAVAYARYDFNTSQGRTFSLIIEKLQDSLMQVVNNVCSPEQLPLFTNQDFGEEEVSKNEIMLKIPLKEFGADPRRYKELKESLRMLHTVGIEVPVKDKNGRDYKRYTGLCEVYIPDEKYANSVNIKIKKDIALRLLDVKSMGIHRYLKDVVFSTRNKYVQRLYIFISAWKSQGATPPIKITELRKMLRLEDAYTRWRAFYSNVIEDARVELCEKAETGETDCYFEVERVYKNGKKRGEPEALKFIIIQSRAGKEAADIQGFVSRKIKIQDFLKSNFSQTASNINTITKRLNENVIDAFDTFLTELNTKVSQQGDKIKELRAWAFTCCMRKLDDLEAEQQAKVEEQIKIVQSAEVSENSKPKSATKKEHLEVYSTEEQESWNRFLHSVKEKVADSTYTTWFVPMVYRGYKDNMLTIGVPSQFFYEYLEAYHLETIRSVLYDVYGVGVNLMYNITEKVS